MTMTKNTILIILISLTLSLILGGVFYYISYKTNGVAQPSSVQEDISRTVLQNSEESAKSQALQKAERDHLVKLLEGELQSCLSGEDDSVGEERDRYASLVYFTIKSLAEGTAKVCESIKNDEDKISCSDYYAIHTAVFKKQSDDCQAINNISLRSLCAAVINNDRKQCDQIQSVDERMKCGLVVTSDIGGCEKLSTKEHQNSCIGGIYLKDALMTGDVGLCDKVRENVLDDIGFPACKIILNGDVGGEQIKEVRRDYCYSKYAFNLAKIKKDPFFCEEIPFKNSHNQEFYNTCLTQSR